MKKFLLSLSFFALISSVSAQRPCVDDYRINNGGGNCPDSLINGSLETPTGSVTLSFLSPVDPANIPTIGNVTEITDPDNPVPLTGITFGLGTLNANGTVTYCYYSGPNNNNNLNGRNRVFRFTVFYRGLPCGEQIGLPVVFQSFTATRNRSTVAVKWETATEINNSGFAVERNNNGSWEQIGFVPSQAAAGNSSAVLSYQFIDLNNAKGITQYRIRQIDLDAKSKFSEIRSVRGDGQKGQTIIYPNPSSDGKVNIVFEERNLSRDILVSDMAGRTVKQMKGVTSNNITIENLTPGMYSLRIVIPGTGEQTMEKIIVSKR